MNDQDPKAPARSKRKRMSKYQRAIMRARLKYPNDSQAQIAHRLGITQPQVCRVLGAEHVKATMTEIMDKAGLTDEFIVNKVKQLAGAKKKTYFASFGKVVDERVDEDSHIQLAATNLAAELKGHKQKKVDVTSNGKSIASLLSEE